MNREEAIAIIRKEYLCVDRDCDIEKNCNKCDLMMPSKEPILKAYKMAIQALEQEPCEMTAEEYRQRMIQAFHNADTDELIAVCVLPTEKEFEHLEWLLKNHYKKEPCEDAISRQAVLDTEYQIKEINGIEYVMLSEVQMKIRKMPSVTPQPNIGHWIDDGFYAEGHSHKAFHCSRCGYNVLGFKEDLSNFCPNCGCRMVEPQESED